MEYIRADTGLLPMRSDITNAIYLMAPVRGARSADEDLGVGPNEFKIEATKKLQHPPSRHFVELGR